MWNKLNFLCWAASYWIRTQIFMRKIPFIGGLVLNESCNLACEHCHVSNRRKTDPSHEEIMTGIQTLYSMGIRTLAITGGEPFFWSSGEHRVRDVIDDARRTGFKAISVYTNGTLPFDCAADTVFVSLDGLETTNNALRGDSVYEKVMENIRSSKHPNIVINFTINKRNSGEIHRICEMVRGNPGIRGIFFYFHTPYYGIDELFMNLEDKRHIIKEIFILKKEGFPIFNSASCLKVVAADTWKRPSDVCVVYAEGKLHRCCRSVGNRKGCDNCGYMGYPEIQQILKLKPDAIRNALNYIAT